MFKSMNAVADRDRSRRAADLDVAIPTTDIVIDLAALKSFEKALIEIEDVPDMGAHAILRKARRCR